MNTDWFLDVAWADVTKGRIIEMSPEDFLNCALPLSPTEESNEKLVMLRGVLASSMKFDSLPLLKVTTLSTDFYPLASGHSYILEHDGRHRATVLKEKGVTSIPVVLISIDKEGEEGITTLIAEGRNDLYEI